MKRYLFDTGIASDYMNRRNQVFARVQQAIYRGCRIGICTPDLAELYCGAEKSNSRKRTLQQIRRAESSRNIWPFTNEAAEAFGKPAAELKRIGRPMQQIDVMIAAIAQAIGNCIVVSPDSDITAIPGLKVENWAAP